MRKYLWFFVIIIALFVNVAPVSSESPVSLRSDAACNSLVCCLH